MGVNRNIDITAPQRKTILELLGRYLPNVTVWVYGSRVAWTSRPQSDLDMVVFSSPEQSMRVSSLKEALEESSLPFRVDLFAWDEVPEQFRRNIEAEHVVLQDKSKVEAVSDWPKVSLSELIEPDRGISYGIVQPGPKVSNGIPIIRVKDIRNGQINTDEPLKVSAEIEASYVRTRLRGGELLLTLVGTVGETAIVPDSLSGWNIARAVAVIPVQEDVGASWVQIALNSPNVKSLIDSRLNTTVQATLNLKDVAQLPILLPPVEERHQIESVISALDDKIELNRKMNKTLEAMAKAIFKSWFIDFEPFRDGGMLDSELGPIPKGWRVGQLDDIASNYRQTAKPEGQAEGTPYIGLADMPMRSIALDSWGGAEDATSVKASYQSGDILFGKLRPYFKKVGVAPTNGVCSSDILVIRPKKGIWFGYALGILTYDPFIDFTSTVSTGTRMPRVNWKSMSGYGLALPPVELAEKFNAFVAASVKRIQSNILETHTLAELRNTLLPKLISGEVRIPEAEQQVEILL